MKNYNNNRKHSSSTFDVNLNSWSRWYTCGIERFP